MNNKLTRLVVITCIALTGIIALQVFWLVNSYREQKVRLSSDVESALIEAQILTGVNNSLNESARRIATDILSGYRRSRANYALPVSGDTIIHGKDTIVNIRLDPPGADANSDSGKTLLQLPGADSGSHEYTLKDYAEKLCQSFATKNIYMPFELALVDSEGNITDCTTDEYRFRQIDFKSNLSFSLPLRLNRHQSGRLQVAFPHAALTLLKKMTFILSLSFSLLAICAFSLTHMILIFFRQKKITEIRNDFMNNITHELKTPISAVSVALELLQDEGTVMNETEKKEYFGLAGNQLKRLTLLVDKVLKIAAFEKGEVKIHLQRFAVKPWLEDIVNSFKLILEPIQAKAVVTVYPEDMEIKADRTHLTNVVQNLVDNAIKYSDKNKSHIYIQVNAWENETHYFLDVQDNGIGIPFMHAPRVFDKFFRVPTGDEHETKGYGLGLSYVKEIIDLHGGEIDLESTYRTGTRFKISIPKI